MDLKKNDKVRIVIGAKMSIPKDDKHSPEKYELISETELHWVVDLMPWLEGREDIIERVSSDGKYFLLRDNGYWFTSDTIEKI